jgi:hypothetical protein
MKTHTNPIAAVIPLLLPLLYVGSYCAMVVPFWGLSNYRFGGRAAVIVYWPLEQVDRAVRPAAWQAEAWQWSGALKPSAQMFLCPTHWEPSPKNPPEKPTPAE